LWLHQAEQAVCFILSYMSPMILTKYICEHNSLTKQASPYRKAGLSDFLEYRALSYRMLFDREKCWYLCSFFEVHYRTGYSSCFVYFALPFECAIGYEQYTVMSSNQMDVFFYHNVCVYYVTNIQVHISSNLSQSVVR